MNGISAILRRDQRACPCPFSVWSYSKKAAIGKQVLTRHQICRHLDLGLLASRTVGDNFCCLKTFWFLVFHYSGPDRLAFVKDGIEALGNQKKAGTLCLLSRDKKKKKPRSFNGGRRERRERGKEDINVYKSPTPGAVHWMFCSGWI